MTPSRCALAFLLALLFSSPTPSSAADRPEARVTYAVDLSQRARQRVTVRMEVRGAPDGPVTLRLPVWRTGLYRILDQAGTVSRVRASDRDGEALSVVKVDKAGWRVDRGSGAFSFSYEVYANALDDRTRYVDDRHAFLNPVAVFMYPEGMRGTPVSVRVPDPPEGWSVSTGLDQQTSDPLVLEAPDYDRLADSPIQLGPQDVVSFQVDGATVELAILGPWDGDGARLSRDVGAMVATASEIFGGLPFERYVFIVHSGQGTGGGTEYYNSTVVQTDDDIWWDEDGYTDFLGLLAHEFFHTWNVKRFRPAGIARYDYQAENYTRSLWVAEGSTSYYDELLLLRAGLVTPAEYLERFSETVHEVLERPAADVQSLEASSFDAWIKFFHPGDDRSPDRVNRVVSFYSRGAVVSFMLDQAIREASEGEASLDDLMKGLYERHPLGSEGYTPQDIRRLASELAGEDLSEFFDAYVSGTEPLDLSTATTRLGLALEREVDDDGDDEEVAYLGLETEPGPELARVDAVRADGPATGVVAGDELVALDDRRIPASGPGSLLERYQPGATVTLTVLRDETMRQYDVELSGRPAGDWRLRPDPEAGPGQREAFGDWSARSWPEDGT